MNDKRVMRSVAESNKQSSTKVISSTLVEEGVAIETRKVHHLDKFDVSNAKHMAEGV